MGRAQPPNVLLDTLLVRTVLVSASLLIIGERAWWPMPLAEARASISAERTRGPGN
ncbi:MAG TPA: hypothetical protein VHZ03_35460 [Trebonia sp.]|nr:hypothetical protein [Trebonia sp.]